MICLCPASAPYDVVITGGGSHGLATAYYLRKHGITDVAVLKKSYIGSGAPGRNTTILRSTDRTPEGARFYHAGMKLYVSISQSGRGAFVMRSEIQPWTRYRTQGTLNPDDHPIPGATEVESFHVSAGWGTYGFEAAPIVGHTLAELAATRRTPRLIAPFALERSYPDDLVSELAAAAVSH